MTIFDSALSFLGFTRCCGPEARLERETKRDEEIESQNPPQLKNEWSVPDKRKATAASDGEESFDNESITPSRSHFRSV